MSLRASTRRPPGRWAALLAALLLIAAMPAVARATYLAPVPLSGAGVQQFTEASFPALAADGQWVAFQGQFGAQEGVWRRNLVTGAVQLVAGGLASDTQQPPDETAPSISANGQFVAFTTTQLLTGDLGADDECPEVYVANMDPADGSDQPTYTLAAVQNGPDGTAEPIQFGSGTCTSESGPQPDSASDVTGAQAAPAVALSADGSEVAFTVDSPSNLGSPASGAPAAGACTFNASNPGSPPPNTTCGGQVVVRNLATGSTTIVSETPSGQPTPWGGAVPSAASSSIGAGLPDAFAQTQPGSTAAISADGTTVAWLGTNVAAQVAPDQQASVAAEIADGFSGYPPNANIPDNATAQGNLEAEPLWRRISDGGSAQTIRLLAGAGLNFFAYDSFSIEPEGSGTVPIAGGSLQDTGSTSVYPPVLSADGEQVAVTSDAPPAAELPTVHELNAADSANTLPNDLYLVDVSDQSAPQATPLTDISSYLESPQESASVDGQPAISPDGSMIAFDTARTSFSTLSSPLLITPPFAYAAKDETFVVDTATGTLQLATSTYDGSPPDGSSEEPSIDDAGDVAVESSANNLFYGDVANAGGSGLDDQQDYLLGAVPQSTAVATESLSAPFTASTPSSTAWTLTATTAQRRDGEILVRASVPGAGTVSATASAQLPSSRRSDRSAIPFRRVAAGRATAHGSSLVSFDVRLAGDDRKYAQSRHGLYARVRVTFTAAGHAALTETVPATFRVRRAPRHGHARPSARRGSTR